MLVMYQEFGHYPSISEADDLEAFKDEGGKLYAVFSGSGILDIVVTDISSSDYSSIVLELFAHGKVNLNNYPVVVNLRRDDD